MAAVMDAPQTIHRGEDDLPFVDLGPEGLLQVLPISVNAVPPSILGASDIYLRSPASHLAA